ncbi:MAG: AMP-binding protein, partial [Pseudomonas sp.]
MNSTRTLADVLAIESTPLAQQALPTSTYDALRRTAEQNPDAPALSFFHDVERFQQPWRWTYRELLQAITRTANALHALGVDAGDVVAFVLPNLPETHFCIWGAEAAGIVMPINPLLDGGQIADLLRAAKAKVLVCLAPTPGHDTWERLTPHLDQLPSVEHLVWVSLAPYLSEQDADAALTLAHAERQRSGRTIHDWHSLLAAQTGAQLNHGRVIAGDEHSSYFCTGGTTGVPKIAVRSHRAEVFNAWSVAAFLAEQPVRKQFFCGLPLFHVNAQLVTGLLPWLQGDHVVLGTPLGYRTPGLLASFWKIVEHYRISFFSGVPTVYAGLLQQPLAGADISSLSYALCGAAPMPVELLREFERVTGLRILEGYGLTEGACVSSINPPQGERRAGRGRADRVDHR